MKFMTKLSNVTAKPWTAGFKESVKLYIEALLRESEITEEAVIRSGKMLRIKDLGGEFFDAFMLLCSGNVNNTDLLVSKIHAIVSNLEIFKFVRISKKLLDSFERDNGLLNMRLLMFINLLSIAYNRGNLVGIRSNEKEVYFIDEPTTADVYSYLLIHLGEGVSTNKGDTVSIPNKKNSEKLKKHLRTIDKLGLLNILYKSDRKAKLRILNNCVSAFPIQNISNMYYELGESEICSDMFTRNLVWERESPSSQSEAFGIGYNLMVNGICSPDIFKNRNRYVRDKGVKIVLKETIDDITHFVLREYHSGKGDHYLFLTYYTKWGSQRMIPLNMKALNQSFLFVLYELDVTAIMFTLSWLGLDEYAARTEKEIRQLPDIMSSVTDPVQVSLLAEGLTAVFEGYKKFTNDDNLIYEEPVSWNYDVKKSTVFRKSEDNSAYIYEKKPIGRFTRTLPAGHKASDEAKALAKMYFIELGDNKTLVDDFVRLQRIKL